MEPERKSPYWDAIVGNNWPAISPGDWSALESKAREGAAALNAADTRAARVAFENRVRASEGLQPVKDDMVAQEGNPQAFADALVAAADVFRDFSDLVHRTCNQILDVVDRAATKIREASSADSSQDDNDEDDDGTSDAEEVRQRVSAIVSEAREDVADIVRAALSSISPQGLPRLADIATALSQPGPWGSGHPDRRQHPGQQGHDGHQGGPSAPPQHTPTPGLPASTGLLWPPGGGPGLLPTEQGPNVPGAQPYPDGPVPPQGTAADPAGDRPTDAGNAVPPSAVPPPGGVAAVPPSPGAPPSAEPGDSEATDPAPSSTDTLTSEAVREPGESSSEQDPAVASKGSRFRSDTADTDISADSQSPLAQLLGGAGAAASAPSAASASPHMVLPQPVASASPASSPASSAAPAWSASSPAQPQGLPADQRITTAGSRDPMMGPGTPASTVSGAAKAQPPSRTDLRADPVNTGSNELIRDVVGAAMSSAAAPAFMVGERVDGDLVLARTLLSGVLAAVDSSTVGLSWAVSVMRHPGGLSAFVTSNEGRGWLPAGLFLPREVSMPWVWAVADGSGWEGVSDPARVLVEFGLAWGDQSGARLAALVSSLPIDARLRGQLGEVPTEGEVAASLAMDLRSPGAGLVDRLGLVGSPDLLDRIAQVPEGEIRARCVERAWDAHQRMGQAGASSPASLDLPGIRQRILAALRQGRAVSDEWWDELRDADDLLAASMLSHRANVARVALGELRSEHSDGRSATEAAILRGMVFQRRCDELVLLLADQTSRQRLRDAVYAHGQIVDHPVFGETRCATSDTRRASGRPTITVGPTQ